VRAPARAGELRERLEQARRRLGAEADAVVLDADHRLPALDGSAQADRALRLGIACRVVQQVAEHLRQACRVGVEHGGLGRQDHRQPVAGGGDVRAAGLERHVDHALERDALLAQREAAARDAADVEQVVDQARELVDLPVDHLAAPGHLWIELVLLAEDGDGVADRRQRIAQLVREHGEEIVLAPLGFAQRLLGELAVVDIGDYRHPAVGGAGGVERRLGGDLHPAPAERAVLRQALVLHGAAGEKLVCLRLDLAHGLLAEHLRDAAPDDLSGLAPDPLRVDAVHPEILERPADARDTDRHGVGDELKFFFPWLPRGGLPPGILLDLNHNFCSVLNYIATKTGFLAN